MTIFELLDTTKKPYFKYGTVPASVLSEFFTFNNIDTRQVFNTDNTTQLIAPVYDICFYSFSSSDVYTVLDNFLKTAKKEGWTIINFPSDITCVDPHLLCRVERVAKINYNEIR